MKKLSVPILFLTIIAVYPPPLNAQISRGGTPYSFSHTVGDSIPTIVLPPVNVDSLIVADSSDTSLRPFRFGFSHGVSFNAGNSGMWEVLPEGGRIWRLKLISLNAYSMNLVFDSYFLNGDAGLFIYNPDQSVILGEFSEDNNKPNGRFATQPLPGDTLILELFEPEGHFGETIVSIEKVVHAYYDIFNESAWCEIDVNCTDEYPWVANWYDQKRSVARLILQDSYCSGFLINNAVNDPGLQYFLTAEHCLYYDSGDVEHCDPMDFVFQFNYENSDCNDQNVFPHHSVNGAQIVAFLPLSNENTGSDFGLLQILETIPDDYHVYYSGWTLNTTPSNEAVGIHHPQGDVKKISRQYTVPIDYYIDWGWDVHWDDGTTEPGSSGSPLFNQDGYVIGQVSFSPGTGEGEPGQHDPCNNFGRWIVYGRFDVSYDHFYPDPEHSLKPWLNPDLIEVTEINGRDWWQVFGCTDPNAYNYDPDATNDDGICYGEKGDINLDECVDVLDLVILTDFILGNQNPNDYEFWAGDVHVDIDNELNVLDQVGMVNMILSNPSCYNGFQRTTTNSFITFMRQSSLSRGEGEILEIILSTETAVRAAQFEFLFPDVDISDVYMSDEFSDLTLDWRMRSDTLAIVLYGSQGEVITAGTNHIAFIEYEDPLGRGDHSNAEYINGYYAGDAGILHTIVMSDQMNQNQTIPDQFILHQPFPNPFNPVTTIAYDLPLDGSVKIAVYNLTGEMITVLESGFKSAGSYKIQLAAGNLASGLYFIRFNCGRFSATQKLFLLK